MPKRARQKPIRSAARRRTNNKRPTRQQRAELKLREKEALLHATFNQAAVGIVVAELDGRFVEVNQKFADMLGYTFDQLRRLTIADVTHPDDRRRTQKRVKQLLAGEGIDRVYEKRYVRRDGAIVWGLATMSLLRDARGNPWRIVRVIEDVSQRRLLLQREREARAEAERTNLLKDEFLATLSHELRTPLAAILGWSHALRSRDMEREELHQGLEKIERNARMQAKLIEDLLDMSRIAAGKVRLDVQPVAPMTFVEAAIETVRPAADAKGIRLVKLLDPVAGPIHGDPQRLQQIVWNLLSNAIKFTPKGGKVEVLLERVNSHVEISVADSGIGIQPEFLPHIFERFRQAEGTSARKYGGLGLGLSIVKDLVELHGGTVQAKSKGDGTGTTVTVHLPLTVVHRATDAGSRVHPRASARAAPIDARAIDLSGIKVLVVDDEPDARELIEQVLKDSAAEVLTAGNAKDALRLVEQERPHVLVSDIGMPETDGYEFLRQVRALGQGRGGDVPAIALTAFARSEDRMRALSVGYQVHVSKPVEPAELIVTVANVAGRTG